MRLAQTYVCHGECLVTGHLQPRLRMLLHTSCLLLQVLELACHDLILSRLLLRVLCVRSFGLWREGK